MRKDVIIFGGDNHSLLEALVLEVLAAASVVVGFSSEAISNFCAFSLLWSSFLIFDDEEEQKRAFVCVCCSFDIFGRSINGEMGDNNVADNVDVDDE